MTEHANGDLLVDVRNHIAHLTLNRPKALNALTHDMVKAMTSLLATWAADENVKAIIGALMFSKVIIGDK